MQSDFSTIGKSSLDSLFTTHSTDASSVPSDATPKLTPEQLTLIATVFSAIPEGIGSSKPNLPKPTTDSTLLNVSGAMGSLSLESLLEALNFNDRKQAVREGLDSIEARGKDRLEANQEKLEQIQENLEKSRSKSILDVFSKAFKWIGIALGAIAAIASIAIGVVGLAAGGSGAALIAGGLVMLTMTVNSIVSEATDGEVSIAVGISKLCEKMGISEEASKWIGFACEIAITIVGVALSLGAGSGSLASASAQTIGKIAATTARVATAGAAIVSIGSGATTIANAAYDYQIAENQAFLKEIEAILQRIQMADDKDLDYIKSIMQQSEELMQAVNELVAAKGETNTAIQTAAPIMA